jgi:hypothetical protein
MPRFVAVRSVGIPPARVFDSEAILATTLPRWNRGCIGDADRAILLFAITDVKRIYVIAR